MVAYCWRSGEIGIGRRVPEGALPIISGLKKDLVKTIEGTATLAYDNKTWLVPGIGTAKMMGKTKIQALEEYVEWLKSRRKTS